MILGKKDKSLVESLKRDNSRLFEKVNKLETDFTAFEQVLRTLNKEVASISKIVNKPCKCDVAKEDKKSIAPKKTKPFKKNVKEPLVFIDFDAYVKDKNISYKELAKKIDMPITSLTYYRKGHPMPKSKAVRIKKILGIK